ncbi:MAG: ATP-binding protein [Firmicutes bacterium]|nr:ATP-binding protein [Bacillota bacterium]
MPVHDSPVEDVLNNLVEQFSDVYCFYRELIQNSIDAGSNRVDVKLEFIPPEKDGGDGVITINIDDYGEGMNKRIIETQLTRLFSSSKEDDLSKIGKFGIGFVSVFAIKPQAVIIDTSRDGEDWRIMFKENKEFDLFRRDYPVEGTKVKIIKSGNKKFYDHFLRKSKETVVFWCKHTEAEIWFQNEKINQPFELDSVLSIREKSQKAEIIAGYVNEDIPFFGFYNQGLTLIEGRKKFHNNTHFKIKSRYLEHTLTRDNIREDENYWKVMEILNNLVKTNLPEKLFETVENQLISDSNETELYQELIPFTLAYFVKPDSMPASCKERKIARTTEGAFLTPLSLLRLRENGGFLYDARSNEVTRALAAQDKTIIKCGQSSVLFSLLEKLAETPKGNLPVTQASSSFYITRLVPDSELPEAAGKIARMVDYINKKMKRKTGNCRFAGFDYPDSCISDRLYVMQNKPGGVSEAADLDQREKKSSSLFSLFSSSGTLVINISHPYIMKICSLAETNPDIASYFLAKLLYMDDGVETNTDAALAMITLEKDNGRIIRKE